MLNSYLAQSKLLRNHQILIIWYHLANMLPVTSSLYKQFLLSTFRVYHPSSGRVLKMFTDQPGVQFYTGNGLDGSPGKGGVKYHKYGAFCLEAQNYPDAINQVSLQIKQSWMETFQAIIVCKEHAFHLMAFSGIFCWTGQATVNRYFFKFPSHFPLLNSQLNGLLFRNSLIFKFSRNGAKQIPLNHLPSWQVRVSHFFCWNRKGSGF